MEILKGEAEPNGDKARQKTEVACAAAAEGRFPVSVVAKTLGVSGSQFHARLNGVVKPRRRYHKADDATVVPLIAALVIARPTYGYRRLTALLNRQLRADGAAPINHKRVYRIMQAQSLLLARRYTVRPDHARNGKVVTLRSNLRWCSDGLEFTWLGTATWSVAPSSSTRTTGRSSPGARSPAQGSAARTCRT